MVSAVWSTGPAAGVSRRRRPEPTTPEFAMAAVDAAAVVTASPARKGRRPIAVELMRLRVGKRALQTEKNETKRDW